MRKWKIILREFIKENYFRCQVTLSMIWNILAEEYMNNDMIKKW